MSYISPQGEQSTSSEIRMTANLFQLDPSPPGQFLRKTGYDTFENCPNSDVFAIWGGITGTLSDQTDLKNLLSTNYIPYSGANTDVNLGNQTFVTAGSITGHSFTAAALGGVTERIVITSTMGTFTTYPNLLYNSTSNQMLISQNDSLVPVELSGTALAVRGNNDTDIRINTSSYGTGVGAYANLHSGGTATLPTAIVSGNRIFSIEGWGRGATTNSSAPRAGLAGFATENWTDSAQGAALCFGTTLNGTITTSIKWSILGDGGLVSGNAGTTANNILTTGTIGAGAVTGTSFIKSGGTSSQFLKADGSVDATTYLSLAGGTMAGI